MEIVKMFKQVQFHLQQRNMDGFGLMPKSTPSSKMKPNPGEVETRFSSFVKYKLDRLNGGKLTNKERRSEEGVDGAGFEDRVR